jgi:hypothetical protein
MRVLLFATTLLGCGFIAAPLATGTIYNSDGSAASVQACHDAAQSGDTIMIPIGAFTWSAPVNFSKAIRLKGAGSGRIIGNTKTSATVGTGTKTFTTTRVIPGIVAGQTLRIAKMPNSITPSRARENYMEGTVTSYSGTTLVLNVTSTGGSGTHQFWWIATKPRTTIISNASLNLSESSAGSIEVLGIQFVVAGNANAIVTSTNAYITPKALVHGCWFQTGGSGSVPAILSRTNEMLLWNCSFDDTFSLAIGSGLQLKWEDDTGSPSWSTNSTMGTADRRGATNFYVEDCDFHGYLNATDFDSNSRVVFRHNVLDNSGMSTHGADTSPIGIRHIEIYDNELIFDNFGDCDGSITLNVNRFFWLRGGTGIITDNILPAISSCAWGTKGNIQFSVLNLTRNAGCYPCWVGYPAPHQVGQGYGTGAVFHQWDCPNLLNDGSYYIFSEPVYIWNNTGTAGNGVSLVSETDGCGDGQQVGDYIQQGRDYLQGVPKPGYQKFVYPHPKRRISAN